MATTLLVENQGLLKWEMVFLGLFILIPFYHLKRCWLYMTAKIMLEMYLNRENCGVGIRLILILKCKLYFQYRLFDFLHKGKNENSKKSEI